MYFNKKSGMLRHKYTHRKQLKSSDTKTGQLKGKHRPSKARGKKSLLKDLKTLIDLFLLLREPSTRQVKVRGIFGTCGTLFPEPSSSMSYQS